MILLNLLLLVIKLLLSIYFIVFVRYIVKELYNGLTGIKQHY